MKQTPTQAAPTPQSAPQSAPQRPPRAARKRDEQAAAAPLRNAAAHSSIDHEEAVRQTAYALYEARGHLDGNALDDWLQAEAMVGRARSMQ